MSAAQPSAALGAALTIDAWADLDEDEPGELVDGYLEEEEVPTVLHELVVAWLLGCLRTWARGRRGMAFGSELELVVGPASTASPAAAAVRTV